MTRPHGGFFALVLALVLVLVAVPAGCVRPNHEVAPRPVGNDDGGISAGSDDGGSTPTATVEVAPSQWDFHDVEVGSSSVVAVAITNRGAAPVAVAATLSGDVAFRSATNCPASLPPGTACSVDVTFAPNGEGSVAAVLAVTGDGVGIAAAMLRGTGTRPAELALTADGAFADPWVDDPPASVTFHVVNRGGDPTGLLAVTLAPGGATAFRVADDGCSGHALAGGAGCAVRVELAPTERGLQTTTLSVTATPGGAPSLALHALARRHARLSLQTGNPDFGIVHDDASARLTLLNDSDEATGPLTVAIASSAASGFSIVADSSNSCGNAVVAPDQSCAVTIAFATHVVGTFSDVLALDGAPLSPTRWMLHAQFTSDSALRFRPAYVGFDSYDAKVQARTLLVENVQSHAVGPLMLTLAGGAPFSITSDACSGATLASGAACIAQLTLTPTANGSFSATLAADAGLEHATAALDAVVRLPRQ